jgi:hypothetical protein
MKAQQTAPNVSTYHWPLAALYQLPEEFPVSVFQIVAPSFILSKGTIPLER